MLLLLPAMQSLIHGNFEGAAQRKAYAMVGASAAIAAAVGPLLGGFITTYLSWRVAFLLEVVIIAVVLSSRSDWCTTCPTRGPRGTSMWSAPPSRWSAWATSCSASSSGRRAARRSPPSHLGALPGALVWWLVRRKAKGKPTLLDPDLFISKVFRFGVSGQMLQQIAVWAAP